MINNYPPFPTQSNHPAKTEQMGVDELITTYDRYSQLGLYIVPKLATKKFPHPYFWAVENRHLRRDRTETLRFQGNSNIFGWCVVTGEHSQRLVVVDIDPSDVLANGALPQDVYNKIQSMSATQFVLATPSYGVHMYYRVPEGLELPTNAAPPIKGVDIRGEGGQVVFIGGYNTYEGDYAEHKGVPDGHRATYSELPTGRYDVIPEMSQELYDWLNSTNNYVESKVERAKNYENTEAGQARLELHFKQPFDARERIVSEALMAVLDSWKVEETTRDEWLQLYMSAHHGSDGSNKIRDIILMHPHVRWSDGEYGRQLFIRTWASHEHKDGGYTVASLFYLARQVGWMTKTGYEIPDERVKTIDVRYVQDWLDTVETVPNRLLLQSQTGSGKTHTISQLWHTLGQPKTVIFVPTKKLATELAQTLIQTHQLPVTLYRDIETYDIVGQAELSNAHILVTTLQTFGTKLNPEMKEYGLVYVEESDQLLQQFARGGGGLDASHVDDKQARKGYSVLRDAFENSGTVWLVDATMSMVSLEVAENMCNTDFEVIRNTRITPKAPVEILPEKDMAYQKVFEGLLLGENVVVVTDTAYEAETVAELMELAKALKGKNSLVITRHTENKPEVRQFMRDVNTGAQMYSLVCYNSVMASGVSITSMTPDRIVQIATYLPPRVNLQLLNRYRSQKQVYVYCTPRESIYTLNAEDVQNEIVKRAEFESKLSSMPIATRLPDAELRARIAAISIADTKLQFRDTLSFYVELLKEDGRSISIADETPVMGRIAQSKAEVKAIHAEKRDYLKQTWQETPPIDTNRPALPEYTAMQIAQGEVHAQIEKALRGNIPDLNEVSPEYVYDVATHFGRFGFVLSAFVNQQIAIDRAEAYLGDAGRSLGNLRANVTLIKLLAILGKLYDGIDAVISPKIALLSGKEFMSAITLAKDAYDAVITRNTQKFDIVYERSDDDAKRAIDFAKILLSKIGLKQRAIRKKVDGEIEYHYAITNIDEARDFLRWRNHTTDEIPVDDTQLVNIVAERKSAYDIFATLSTELQQDIIQSIDKHNTFADIVKVLIESEQEAW